MQLGGIALEDAFQSGTWKAFRGQTPIPMDELMKLIGPNSVDVTLDHRLLRNVSAYHTDPFKPETIEWEQVEIPEEGFPLGAGECYLGAVRERFECDAPLFFDRPTYWKPDIEGISSLARLFIQTHMTAGFGDYGFRGAFTLEIHNASNRAVVLHRGMRISQVFFSQVMKPKVYQGAYSQENHYDGPRPPKLGKGRV